MLETPSLVRRRPWRGSRVLAGNPEKEGGTQSKGGTRALQGPGAAQGLPRTASSGSSTDYNTLFWNRLCNTALSGLPARLPL